MGGETESLGTGRLFAGMDGSGSAGKRHTFEWGRETGANVYGWIFRINQAGAEAKEAI